MEEKREEEREEVDLKWPRGGHGTPERLSLSGAVLPTIP